MTTELPLTSKLLRRLTLDAVRASEQVPLRCPHATECGGCAFQDRAYAAQVAAKREILARLWADTLPAELQASLAVVPSPDPFEYRTRMDYVATKGRFGLRRSGKFNYIVELEQCHLIPPAGFDAARQVYQRAMELNLPDYNLRSHEGFLRYVVVRRSPQNTLLLAAVTAAPDADGVQAAAMAQVAARALEQPGVVGLHWLVNDTLTDISFGAPYQHWGAATLPMQVGARTLQIGPNTFFQNNVHLLMPLLEDVRRAVVPHAAQGQSEHNGDSAPVVADLYGGVGTIALHLADSVERVVCVESVDESVNLAQHNISSNGVTNVTAVAADVAAFVREQARVGFDVVVADPPRTGLGPEVCAELLRLRPRRIVYVSCNPLTQLEDARVLLPTYRITALRGYDMFPHTPHQEALAIFDLI